MTEGQSCSSCSDSSCASKKQKEGESSQMFKDRQDVAARMCNVKHKILILSGKGGVGKSTVAVNLAASLALNGKNVGLMDIDVHGPSIPKLLHLEDARATGNEDLIEPVPYSGLLKVMSIAFFLPNKDDAVIWRGPMKFTMIKQFLKDVEWGDLDYLIVDCPPGTGDEPLSIVQLLDSADGAVLVTTPQDISTADVRRSVRFCETLKVNVIGCIENMSGFVCPHCNEVTQIFGSGGGEAMSKDMGIPFLGSIPLDPKVVEAGDAGKPAVESKLDSATTKAYRGIVEEILERTPDKPEKADNNARA